MSDDAIEIIHSGDESGGAYRVALAGVKQDAKLTWRSAGENIRSADHTFTPPEMRGKGIAKKLVEALIRDAREQGFKIEPQCPYVADKFDENPDWADLRA